MIRRLIDDRRGSAILAPVFIVLSVILIATVLSSLLFTQSVSERTSAQLASSAATRSAVAAMAAELNTTPLATITAEVTAEGSAYAPSSWIPAAGQTMHVTRITAPTADTVRITFTVDTGRGERSKAFTVEYRSVPGPTPPQTVWTPARTIQEAS